MLCLGQLPDNWESTQNIMSGGKGKRRPSGPMITSSDEEDDPVTGPSPSPSSVSSNGVEVVHSPTNHVEHDYALPDHDYENVSSPGNSSTASGPTYVRQPGFTQHAHEVTVSRPRTKKKKTTLIAMKEGLRKREPTPPKTKPKRGKIDNH